MGSGTSGTPLTPTWAPAFGPQAGCAAQVHRDVHHDDLGGVCMAIVIHSPGRWVESCHQLTSISMAELCFFGVDDISDARIVAACMVGGRLAGWLVASLMLMARCPASRETGSGSVCTRGCET
jgi:hypothetical protein